MIRFPSILAIGSVVVGCSAVDDAAPAADVDGGDSAADRWETAGDEGLDSLDAKVPDSRAAEDSDADGGSPEASPDSSTARGKLRVSPADHRWLQFGDQDPIYVCGVGDPEGFLYRGTRNADGTRSGDQDALIAKLVQSRANGAYFQAIRSHGGDGEPDHNPFVDSDPSKGLDEDILDQWDGWLTQLDSGDVVSYFFLYDDSARVWDTGDSVGPPEKAMISGIVSRFTHHRGIVWVVAEEYAESLSPARVKAIAAEIRAADPVHPIAVHKNSGLSFGEFANDPSIDLFAIQYNVSTSDELHSGMVEAGQAAGGSYALTMSEVAEHGAGDVARQKNWAIAFGGAYVLVLGWDIASTAQADLEGCSKLSSFMRQSRFWTMAPHDELKAGSTAYVFAAPGEGYLAYSSAGGAVGIRGLNAGKYKLRWIVPATGSVIVEEKQAEGDALFPRPVGFDGPVALHAAQSE